MIRSQIDFLSLKVKDGEEHFGTFNPRAHDSFVSRATESPETGAKGP
jgi:hypothetical protein